MKKLIEKILAHFGYVTKEHVSQNYVHNNIRYQEFDRIIESFGAVKYVHKYGCPKLIYKAGPHTVGHISLLENQKDAAKNVSYFHQYIYDRGVKAIIDQHEKELKQNG